MATPSEKHEIHCAKRYLEYTETPFYRAFRDKENPESFDSNYAVLKRMEEAEQSLAARGVHGVGYSSPASRPCDALYRRLGAKMTETVWFKEL